jgi:hypothetical protein
MYWLVKKPLSKPFLGLETKLNFLKKREREREREGSMES